jgi:nucleoside-diphosphate-sugar epimerase
MKVITTGGTGLIGGAVLRHCIQDPSVTHIYALTRRPLPEELTLSDKLTIIIHSDFSTYPDDLLNQLFGAEACILSLGVSLHKGNRTREAYYDPDVVYTVNAAKSFVEKLQPQLNGKKFRFVYVSGTVAERDQDNSLWIGAAARQVKVCLEYYTCFFSQYSYCLNLG